MKHTILAIVLSLLVACTDTFLHSNLVKLTSTLRRVSTVVNSVRESVDNHQQVIGDNFDELVRLRGTPELVDKLESLVRKFPGIEVR